MTPWSPRRNGDIPGRGRLHRNVVARAEVELVAHIDGNTDSELAFVLYRTYLQPLFEHEYPPQELAVAMEKTIRQIVAWQEQVDDGRPLALNFCVTDGRSLVATRFAVGDVAVPTLHYCAGERFVCEGGTCRMDPCRDRQRCVLVASERLSNDPGWVAIERQSVVVVLSDLSVEVTKLEIPMP